MTKQSERNVTDARVRMSFRVTIDEESDIRIAARAANMKIGTYVRKRIFDQPVFAAPALSALAEVMSALKRLENAGELGAANIAELELCIDHLASAVAQELD